MQFNRAEGAFPRTGADDMNLGFSGVFDISLSCLQKKTSLRGPKKINMEPGAADLGVRKIIIPAKTPKPKWEGGCPNGVLRNSIFKLK